MSDPRLDRILERIKSHKLPPVQDWDPPLTGELDMRIDRDGKWHYMGSLIRRDSMVRLFSTVLKREGGAHFLVTPVEKYRIQVEDAAFIAVEVERIGTEIPALVFRTNVGDEVIAGADHPVTVDYTGTKNEPRPYLEVRHGLMALISRNVFYQIAGWSHTANTGGHPQVLIESCGQEFVLGRL